MSVSFCVLAAIAVAGPAGGTPPKSRTASRAPGVSAARTWHSKLPGKNAPTDASGRPMLVLQGLNIPDRVELAARTDHGGFSAEDLDRAAHVMREPSTGNEHPIDPRLLDFVYRVQAHFHAPEVRIISGYRTPRHGGTSNHGKGRAMDLVVPGTTDEEVAKFAREQGFVGVGVYPTSGFVHLDIRERSFFWVDRSGPGKRSRVRGILADLAQKSDAQALSRGEKAIEPFHLGSEVDKSFPANAVAQAAASSEDEDTDEKP